MGQYSLNFDIVYFLRRINARSPEFEITFLKAPELKCICQNAYIKQEKCLSVHFTYKSAYHFKGIVILNKQNLLLNNTVLRTLFTK
jgi:hypothetical protein